MSFKFISKNLEVLIYIYIYISSPKFTSCNGNLWLIVIRSLEMFYGHVLFNEQGIDIVLIKLVLEGCDQALVLIQQR